MGARAPAPGLSASPSRRHRAHAFRRRALACHGVPLVDGSGELYGSLCHFDLEPWGISEEEFEHLQLAAMLMPEFLPRNQGAASSSQ